ncbi:MAG: glycosyltransferase involved in cell wall biosynthesis [Granulosicoccus sp.]|jgi:glycosyltransferase involved in cell wall biosynthesis
MKQYVFDLTEVFRASTGKFKMYGILRVVEETARAFIRKNAAFQYAFFSYAHGGFIEVFPTIESNGEVKLNVPKGISEYRVVANITQYSWVLRQFLRLTKPWMERENLRQWEASGGKVTTLDLSDKVIVSAARPKFLVDALHVCRAKENTFELYPLLHDMIPLHKQFRHRTAHFASTFLRDNVELLNSCELILTNSEFTKTDTLVFSEQGLLPSPKAIAAIPLVHEAPGDVERATITIPVSPYVMTVGITLGRKNLEVVFDAMKHMAEQGYKAPRLVICGAIRKKMARHLESDAMASVRDNIELIPSPEQDDLVALYTHALAVLMPSRMEGWGLPAGEALWCGTPAICSTAPVLKEVCGDLGLYFDPDSPEELSKHIRSLNDDPDYLADLKTRIKAAKPRLRTWQSVADDLVSALTSQLSISNSQQ